MTPGVVEIEHQRFRVTRDADEETVVIRDRTIPHFIDCAERGVRNGRRKSGKVDRSYPVEAWAAVIYPEGVRALILNRLMISVIADVGEREDRLLSRIKRLLNLEAVFLIGWVVQLARGCDDSGRGEAGNAVRKRVETRTALKPSLKGYVGRVRNGLTAGWI